MRLLISTAILVDHQSRLYDGDKHLDVEDAFISEIASSKTTSTIEITEAALKELMDDLDYLIEFSYNSAEKSKYKRALAKLKEAI